MKCYALTLAAEDDINGIWQYSYKQWGFDQAEKYYDQLEVCCEAIGKGQARLKQIEGLPDGVCVYRCQEHYIFFLGGERPIIIAVLHGSMRFAKWLSKRV